MRKIISLFIITVLPFCSFAQGHFQFAPSVNMGFAKVNFRSDAFFSMSKVSTVGATLKFMSDHHKFQFGGALSARGVTGTVVPDNGGNIWLGRSSVSVSYFLPQFLMNYKFLINDKMHIYTGLSTGAGLADNGIGNISWASNAGIDIGWVYSFNHIVELEVSESIQMLNTGDGVYFLSNGAANTLLFATNIGVRLNKR